MLERVAERPRDRDVLLHVGQVLAWQRVVQELLEVVARDAERRAILVGSEPFERAAQIECDLPAQSGRVAIELGLFTVNGTPGRIPTLQLVRRRKPAHCGQRFSGSQSTFARVEHYVRAPRDVRPPRPADTSRRVLRTRPARGARRLQA